MVGLELAYVNTCLELHHCPTSGFMPATPYRGGFKTAPTPWFGKKQTMNNLIELLNKKDIGQYLGRGAKMVWGGSGLVVLAQSPGCMQWDLTTARGRDALCILNHLC